MNTPSEYGDTWVPSGFGCIRFVDGKECPGELLENEDADVFFCPQCHAVIPARQLMEEALYGLGEATRELRLLSQLADEAFKESYCGRPVHEKLFTMHRTFGHHGRKAAATEAKA